MGAEHRYKFADLSPPGEKKISRRTKNYTITPKKTSLTKVRPICCKYMSTHVSLFNAYDIFLKFKISLKNHEKLKNNN